MQQYQKEIQEAEASGTPSDESLFSSIPLAFVYPLDS